MKKQVRMAVVVVGVIISFLAGIWIGISNNNMHTYKLMAVTNGNEITVDHLKIVTSRTEMAIIDEPSFTIQENVEGMVKFTLYLGDKIIKEADYFVLLGDDGKPVTFLGEVEQNYYKKSIIVKGGESSLDSLRATIEIQKAGSSPVVEEARIELTEWQ